MFVIKIKKENVNNCKKYYVYMYNYVHSTYLTKIIMIYQKFYKISANHVIIIKIPTQQLKNV